MIARQVPLSLVQQELLRALRAVDEVCRARELCYWLDGGTLLGAIRHQGFVPWDDDIDICLPRKDLNSLLAAAGDLPASVQLSMGRRAGHAVNAKVLVPTLLGVPYGMQDEAQNASLPIGIDIIAVDGAVKSARLRRPLSRVARALASRYAAAERAQASDSALSRSTWRVLERTPPRIVHRLQDWLVTAHSIADGELLQYGIDTAMPDTVFPRNVVLPTKPVDFEGLQFPGPAYAHEYLRIYYGDDFMTPPVIQRSSHASSFWFSG